MEAFSLKLNGNIFIFLFICFALIGLSFFVYRHTIPPVPNWLKRSLTILRIISLIIILFVLFEPILSLSWNRSEKPVVAVLLDNSASMSLTDNGQSRSNKARKVLESGLFQKISKDKEIEYYQFSDNLAPLDLLQLDSVKFNRDGTDLTAALKAVEEKNVDRYLRGVVIISDGIDNLGENPIRYAEDFDVPIFPIAIGFKI